MTISAKVCWPLVLLAAWVGLNCCRATAQESRPISETDYPGAIAVACLGDSITYGYGFKNRERDSYPSQLSRLLGEKWNVKNFGVNGAGVLRQGRRPYVLQPAFEQALAWEPDVVVLMLGTNDTRREDWEAHQDEFTGDLADLIERLAKLKSQPRIYLCLPVPIFRDRGQEHDLGKVLQDEILPKIRQVAKQAKLPLIDLHAPFESRGALFPDEVHPTEEGAALLAATVSTALIGRPAKRADAQR